MRVTPNTVKTLGTVTATLGTGIAGSSLPAGSAIGGAMTSYGTSVLGGHVITSAIPVVVAAAPVVATAGAVVATVAAVGWLCDKLG